LEWEQIDREKDKTVLSLNQTIAILQRDLTMLLEEKEKAGQYPSSPLLSSLLSPTPLKLNMTKTH
jgi:hypothetical protein